MKLNQKIVAVTLSTIMAVGPVAQVGQCFAAGKLNQAQQMEQTAKKPTKFPESKGKWDKTKEFVQEYPKLVGLAVGATVAGVTYSVNQVMCKNVVKVNERQNHGKLTQKPLGAVASIFCAGVKKKRETAALAATAAKLQQEIQQSNQQTNQLKEENEKLSEQVTQLKEQFAQLRKQQLKEKKIQLETFKNSKNENDKLLRQVNQDHQKMINNVQTKSQELNQQITNLKQGKAQLEQQVKAQLVQQQKIENDAQTKGQELSQQITNLKQEVSRNIYNIKNDLTQNKQKLDELKTQKGVLEQKFQQKVETLPQGTINENEKIKMLAKVVKQLNKQNEELNSNLQKEIEDKNKFRSFVKYLRTENVQLKETLARKEQKLSFVKDKIETALSTNSKEIIEQQRILGQEVKAEQILGLNIDLTDTPAQTVFLQPGGGFIDKVVEKVGEKIPSVKETIKIVKELVRSRSTEGKKMIK